MASPAALRHASSFFFFLAVLFACTRSCQAQDPIAIVARAMLCFDNATVYANCQQQYLLASVAGLNSTNATNAFCSAPCRAQTQLILRCIDAILSNFQFYNSATIQAVNATIFAACGNSTRPAGNTTVALTSPAPARPPMANGAPGLPRTPHVPLLPGAVGTLHLWLAGFLVLLAIA